MYIQNNRKIMLLTSVCVMFMSIGSTSPVYPQSEKDILPVELQINYSLTDAIFPELKNKEVELEEQRIKEEKALIEFEQASKTIVFDANDITKISNLTEEELANKLKPQNLEYLASSYIAAEEKYGVNALALVSISAIESAWGKSSQARNKNNLFGLMGYNGKTYPLSFESKNSCIDYAAKNLRNNYLNQDGKWHNGVSLASINKRWAADTKWHTKISSLGYQLSQN